MNRSLLFVPGDSDRKFAKALEGTADALILDLEDSVQAEQKSAARLHVAGMLAADRRGKDLWVRVNALDSGLMLGDLAAVMPAAPHGIVIPKCHGRDTLLTVTHYLDAFEAANGSVAEGTRILAIATETGRSIFGMGSYADVTPRLWGLTWGAEDLAADLGALSNRDGDRYAEPYRLARSLCLLAAAAAGVQAIDTVCVALDDEALLMREASEGFRDGFAGKMAIHPKHVATIQQAYRPTDEQARWAERVIEAFAKTPDAGALRLDGKMIDMPHLRLARRLNVTGQ